MLFLLLLLPVNCRPLHLLKHLRLHYEVLLLLLMLLVLRLLIHGLILLRLEFKGDHFCVLCRLIIAVGRSSCGFLLEVHDIIILLAILA